MKQFKEFINEGSHAFYTLDAANAEKDIKAFKEFLDTLSSKTHLFIHLYDNRLSITSYENGELQDHGLLRLKKYE